MKKFLLLLFALVSLSSGIDLFLSPIAVPSSGGNFVGKAIVAKKENFKFIDVGLEVIGNDSLKATFKDKEGKTIGHEGPVSGISIYKIDFNVYNYRYSLGEQKGGLSFSIPATLLSEIGLKITEVQWFGNFYLGASFSFTFGFYMNTQNKEHEEVYTSGNKYDLFPLWSVGIGYMFDVSPNFSLGAYGFLERMAIHCGGYYAPPLLEDYNVAPFSFKHNLVTFGGNFVYKRFGMYLEYAPLQLNKQWLKVKSGILIFY